MNTDRLNEVYFEMMDALGDLGMDLKEADTRFVFDHLERLETGLNEIREAVGGAK